MRRLLAAATIAATLVPAAAAAAAGDPVMPLAQVRSGMHCTGYSVVRGTTVSSFTVDVLDVVDDRATGEGPRILVRASGPAVDDTGIGPGFSGSPIYCPDATGTPRNIGAISEGIGDYGGDVVLATPIESILGNPVAAPHARAATAMLARARPLQAPITVTGLRPRLGNALQAAAARHGRVLLAAPAGPLGSFPPQRLVPGSAFGVGYASGDISASAIGTVAYTDGASVWGFGHQLDGVGARALLLQDAYVFRVIGNPLALADSIGTYKYAAAGHDLGTLSNDALDAVVGRVGALPPTIPVRVVATDLDTGAHNVVHTSVADESGVDDPTGGSILSFIAPLAVTQAAGTVLHGSPARLTGRACFAISFAERDEPVRFCNRYVTNAPDFLGAGNTVAGTAGSDMFQAMTMIDSFNARPVHVTGIDVDVQIGRGQRQAFLRSIELPRRGKAGHEVRATLVLRHVRGALERRRVDVMLPERARPGLRRIVFKGKDVDTGIDDLLDVFDIDFGFGDGSGDLGSPNRRVLFAQLDGLARYDGLSAKPAGGGGRNGSPGTPSYLDPDLRISGRAVATIRIKRR